MIINVTLDTNIPADVAALDALKNALLAAAPEGDAVEVEEVKAPKAAPKKAKKAAPKKAKKAAPKKADPKPEPAAAEQVDIGNATEVAVGGDAEFTLDNVRDSFRAFVEANDIEAAASKLAVFDSARLSDLPEEKWGEFVASLNG